MGLEHPDPSVAHKVIDVMGDKLSTNAQYSATIHPDPSVVHKVINNMGDKLDRVARYAAMNHPDFSVKEKAQKLYGGRN